MALVICAVFLTERMRRRTSRVDGIRWPPSADCASRLSSAHYCQPLTVHCPQPSANQYSCPGPPSGKLFDSCSQLLQQVVGHLVFAGHRLFDHSLADLWMVGIHVAVEGRLPFRDLIDRRIIQVAVSSSIDGHNLFLYRYRLILGLLEDFCEALAATNTRFG